MEKKKGQEKKTISKVSDKHKVKIKRSKKLVLF